MIQEKISTLQNMLLDGIAQGLYSGAQLVVSDACDERVNLAVGKTKNQTKCDAFVPAMPITQQTLFDVASLTKPLVTASLYMIAAENDAVPLNRKLLHFDGVRYPTWLLGYTLSDLLSHHTPLQAWLDMHGTQPRLDDRTQARNHVERMIFESEPRSDSQPWTYSDLGYILLGFQLESMYEQSLQDCFKSKIAVPLGLSTEMMFCPLHSVVQKNIAATCHIGSRAVQGHPDDANARALIHVAGHAGLFASASAIAAFVRSLLGENFPVSMQTRRAFFEYQNPETPFALGWDRPTGEDSLSGRTSGEHVIGHLGFTGCSLWIDLDTKRSVVFLTNRTHVNEDPKSLGKLRRDIHHICWGI